MPDTSSYMIAGFMLIFSALFGYAFSLYFRTRQIQKRLTHKANLLHKPDDQG
jgi:hypothetical protein